MGYKYMCLICKGTKKEKNPNFECCLKKDNNWEIMKGKNCNSNCPAYDRCKDGEEIDCYNCNGDGYMIVDKQIWKRIS